MKAFTTKFSCVLALSLALSTPALAVWPPPEVEGDELAVWQAVAGTIQSDNTERPYKLWFAESDFSAGGFISSALSDPDKEEFCGLSGTEMKGMITRLKSLSLEPVHITSDIARNAGVKIAHKKNPRMRYFAMSRVVFAPSGDKAWLSVELNGERGSIVRMDKKDDGSWYRHSRCGGWYMPSE